MEERLQSLSDLTARCIGCGFCLESCPTFVLSGDETRSPRGRISLIRLADEGSLVWSQIRDSVDTCLGCRACETSCPSGVKYGDILEMVRDRMPASASGRLALVVASRFRILRMLQVLGIVKSPQALGGVSMRRRESLVGMAAQASEGAREAFLHSGCAMRAVFPGTLEACRKLILRAGLHPVNLDLCCGALHAHSGFVSQGKRRLRILEATLPPNVVVISPSAGCGSYMKEHSDRTILDLSEFLIASGFAQMLSEGPAARVKVAYHEACHLVHAQRVSKGPLDLINAVRGVELVELPEATMCCGSAGVFNAVQPEIARQLLDRKWANIGLSKPDIVVLGNPGCHGWIAQGGEVRHSTVRILHLAEFVELALQGKLSENHSSLAAVN